MTVDVAELRRLLAKGTRGPWLQGTHVDEPRALVSIEALDVSLLGTDADGMAVVEDEADAALICAAINALPDLLDEVERLRDALEWYDDRGKRACIALRGKP